MLLSKMKKKSYHHYCDCAHPPLHEFLNNDNNNNKKKVIHSRLELPFQRNLSNEKGKGNKSFFVNWD